MQEQIYREVGERASEVHESGEGTVQILTEEEEQMIHALRRFKLRCTSGSVFKWQTRPSTELLIAEETGLIRHPQEVA